MSFDLMFKLDFHLPDNLPSFTTSVVAPLADKELATTYILATGLLNCLVVKELATTYILATGLLNCLAVKELAITYILATVPLDGLFIRLELHCCT